MRISNNRIIGTMAIVTGFCVITAYPAADLKKQKPNFIIILTDDQGYNDLGCFGSEGIKTPHIDRLAQEGFRLTCFYAQTVSGPSSGVLLTGRYTPRIGRGWITNADEITIPEVLKGAGYKTGCVGKWGISQRKYQEGLVPNDQGFDYYFGTLGANERGTIQFYRNREALNTTNGMSILTSLDPPITTPELYDIESDISEKTNLAEKYPKKVKRLFDLANEAHEDITLFIL